MNARKIKLLWEIYCLISIFLLAGCSASKAKQISSTLELTNQSPTQKTITVPTTVKKTHFTETLTPTRILIPTLKDSSILKVTSTISWTPTPTESHTATDFPKPSSSPTLLPVMPRWIAFSNWGPGNDGIYMIDNEGKNWKKLTTEPGFYFSPSWSPNGHWIAYAMYSEALDGIYVVSIKGQGPQRLIDVPGQVYLAWSPDGNKIAYTHANDIYVYNINSHVTTRLTDTPTQEGYPIWSPDGSQIAYLAQLEDPVNTPGAELYVMNSNGSNPRRVTKFIAEWGKMAWSPDGQRIAFSSRSGCQDIYTIKLDGIDLQQLTNRTGRENNPTWSPDGQKIAFNMTATTCEQMRGDSVAMGWQIYVMNSDGSGVSQVTKDREWYPLDPVWSPVPAFNVSGIYTITTAGANLNLRESPSLNGKVLEKLEEGDIVTILEGPEDVDDYYWWRMRTEEGVEGWAVEVFGWYTLANNQLMTPTLTPSP